MAEMSGERKQLDLRAKVSKMVVEIHGAYPDPTLEDSDKKKYNSMVGTIVLATPHFCFGVLRRSVIQEDGIYTIKCDGQSIEIKAEDFVSSYHGFFAGFYIYHNKLPYDIKNVAAVEFDEEVKLFDVVNLCDIIVGPYKMFIDITDGHVMDVRVGDFVHNCAHSLHTSKGAPVFSKNGKLVGVCILNLQGPSVALDVTRIKAELMMIHETKTLEEFFEVVRASAGNAEASAAATVQPGAQYAGVLHERRKSEGDTA